MAKSNTKDEMLDKFDNLLDKASDTFDELLEDIIKIDDVNTSVIEMRYLVNMLIVYRQNLLYKELAD